MNNRWLGGLCVGKKGGRWVVDGWIWSALKKPSVLFMILLFVNISLAGRPLCFSVPTQSPTTSPTEFPQPCLGTQPWMWPVPAVRNPREKSEGSVPPGVRCLPAACVSTCTQAPKPPPSLGCRQLQPLAPELREQG